MTAPDKPPIPSGARTRVGTLLMTLREERAALEELVTQMSAQLDALCDQSETSFAACQQKADAALETLERLRPSRRAQLRSIGRLLDIDPHPVAVETVVSTLTAYPDWQLEARDLLVLHKTIERHSDVVAQQCDVVESFLQSVQALQQDMDRAVAA